MKNIEKSLINFVRGKTNIIDKEELCDYASKDADELINILFQVINEELDSLTKTESLAKTRELFDCINVVLINADNVNRKIVFRKLKKLDEKIDRLELENKNKYLNLEKAMKELEKTRNEIQSVETHAQEKETKHYDFINYLINDTRNITYLEYTFNKMPNLVNAKDKNDIPLFYNMIKKIIESIKCDNEDDILYYNNIISLLLSENNLSINDNQKRKILQEVNTAIDQFQVGKKQAKKNKNKIQLLTDLVDCIKGLDEKQIKLDSLATKYNIQIHFNEDILEDARLVKIEKSGEIENRTIVDDYIITIDGSNAIEIDDALSCKKLKNGNYLLGVHIASILGYFPYESAIIKEAISRNHSLYLPFKYQSRDDDFNRTIPIFPYSFSTKTASLNPNEKKLARSYFFELDKEGNVVSEKFLKTIIESKKKTTYDEINKILENGCDDKNLEETVRNLEEVTELLDRNYKGIELYEHLKENNDDYSDLRVKRIGSEKIVYQTMLLTGNRVANYFANSKKGYPCLYRVHEVDEENSKKLQDLVDGLTKTYGGDQYKKLYQLIQGIYPKGWYDVKGSHAGLGLDHYCHCTSGLRRGADIVVEHALEVCYDKEPTDKEIDNLTLEIKKKAGEINAKQAPMDWFINDYKRAYQRRR